MAIPFQLPNCRSSAEDYQNLDKLLSDLFEVLARILAQRGTPVAALSTGAVTIRRPTHQLRLQVSDEPNTDSEAEIVEVSSEESSSDGDSEAGSAPPSPTATSAPVSLSALASLPDLVSDMPLPLALPALALADLRDQDHEQEHELDQEQLERLEPARVPVRSRCRKPKGTPRKARSPRGARSKRSHLAPASPAKELTRTPSTRAQKATPTVC